MIPEKLMEIMEKDGVVAIATLGPGGPHMVNTWNSYLRISKQGQLLIPVGYMHRTEANIAHDPNILITLGSSKVEGLHGAGAGFLIKGKARFLTSGPEDPGGVTVGKDAILTGAIYLLPHHHGIAVDVHGDLRIGCLPCTGL